MKMKFSFQRVRRSLHRDLHHPLPLPAVPPVFLHNQHCRIHRTHKGCPFPMEPHQLLLTLLTCLRSYRLATTLTVQPHTLNKVSPAPSNSALYPESLPPCLALSTISVECYVSRKRNKCLKLYDIYLICHWATS